MLCGKDNQPSQIEKHSSEMKVKAIKIQGFFFLVVFFSYLSGRTGSWLWHVGPLIFAVARKLLVRHMGSSFLTRSGPQALCTRRVESRPLDYPGRPFLLVICVYFLCFSAFQSYKNLIQKSTPQPQVTLHKPREKLNFALFF